MTAIGRVAYRGSSDPPVGGVEVAMGRRRGRAARSAVRAALAEGRGLADAVAQEVQLGAAGDAVADDLDLLDARAVDLERPLDADARRRCAGPVMERVMPPPRRRMTVPSKTWMRSRLPSTTLADTLTVSPVASSGRSVRSWS